MSGMVTVRTRKLWTCLPGTPRWIVGWQQTSAGTRKLFLADQSSHPSSAFRFVPGILGHWHSWGQVFPWPLERNRGSRWESCTLLSFWQLQSQRHWHWWRHYAGDRRSPKCPLVIDLFIDWCWNDLAYDLLCSCKRLEYQHSNSVLLTSKKSSL